MNADKQNDSQAVILVINHFKLSNENLPKIPSSRKRLILAWCTYIYAVNSATKNP